MKKKYLSNKYTKIFCLNSLSNVINNLSSSGESNQLIIHTANGMFIGTLRDFDNTENYELSDNDDIITMYRKTYLKALDNIKLDEDTEHISENPISITLENVKIISSNLTTNLPFVDIFIDQIIGISFGSISDHQN